MFSRDFDKLFDQISKDMWKMAAMNNTPIEEVHEGYRKEVVNGETTEYYLDDGEWKEFGADDTKYELTDDTFTIDLSGEISGVGVASASFNNGILSVEFTSDSDEE